MNNEKPCRTCGVVGCDGYDICMLNEIDKLQKENADLRAQLETQATVSKAIIARLKGELEQERQATAEAREAARDCFTDLS